MTRVLEADRGAVGRPHQDRRSIRARARSTARRSNTCCATPSAATGSAARCRSTSTCRSASARSTSTHDGEKKTPVMLHRAICGSMERFIGILIEHYRRALPALARAGAGRWSHHHVGGRRLRRRGGRRALRKAGLRVEADLRNEKINYKVREHSLAKVPVLLVVGTQGGGRAHGLDPPPGIAGAKVARIGAGARRSRGRGAAARPASAPLPRTRAAPRSISPSTAITSSRGRSPRAR